MPLKDYRISVRNGTGDEMERLANAVKYLAATDVTNNIGLRGDISDVYIGSDRIGLTVTIPFTSDKREHRFQKELQNLSRVTDYRVIE